MKLRYYWKLWVQRSLLKLPPQTLFRVTRRVSSVGWKLADIKRTLVFCNEIIKGAVRKLIYLSIFLSTIKGQCLNTSNKVMWRGPHVRRIQESGVGKMHFLSKMKFDIRPSKVPIIAHITLYWWMLEFLLPGQHMSTHVHAAPSPRISIRGSQIVSGDNLL